MLVSDGAFNQVHKVKCMLSQSFWSLILFVPECWCLMVCGDPGSSTTHLVFWRMSGELMLVSAQIVQSCERLLQFVACLRLSSSRQLCTVPHSLAEPGYDLTKAHANLKMFRFFGADTAAILCSPLPSIQALANDITVAYNRVRMGPCTLMA